MDLDRDPVVGEERLRLLPPASERLCDAVVLTFAAWTLCAHIAILLGATLPVLLAGFLATIPFAYVGWKRLPRAMGDAWTERSGSGAMPGRYDHTVRWVTLFVAILALASFDAQRGLVTTWIWAMGLLGLGLVTFGRADVSDASEPTRSRHGEKLLWLLALLCAALALVAHRTDGDDVFYAGIAAAAASNPDRPLLGSDPVHGVRELPVHLAVYRVHTYELLVGAFSYLSRVPALYAFHWLAAGLGAFLVPLAHAKLFRLLVPRFWLAAVVAVLVVLVAVGDQHRWYGNFALVRIWQGKALMLSVALPLLASYAIDFTRNPSLRSWLLFAAAQTGAIGLTSSALWWAPVSATLWLFVALEPSWRATRVLGVGMLASAHPIVAGLLVRPDVAPLAAKVLDIPAVRNVSPDLRIGNAFVEVLGDGRLFSVAVFAIFVAWALCPRGLGQRAAILVPLGALATVLNPFATRLVIGNMTGPAYWRALWVLPVPILIALLIVSPLHVPRLDRRLARMSFAAALVGFVVWVPATNGLGRGNYVKLDLPTLKVRWDLFHWIQALNEAVPEGSVFAGPPDILALPVVRPRAHPIAVRDYLNHQTEHIGAGAVRERIQLTQYLGGELTGPDADALFARALEDYRISGVCLRLGANTKPARAVLVEAGFERTFQDGRHELWVRARGDGRPSTRDRETTES